MNSLVKTVTWVIGIVFLIIGIMGFLGNEYPFGLKVDVLHNIVHAATGIAAILAAVSGESYARLFLIIFGITYGALAVLGFIQFPTGEG